MSFEPPSKPITGPTPMPIHLAPDRARRALTDTELRDAMARALDILTSALPPGEEQLSKHERVLGLIELLRLDLGEFLQYHLTETTSLAERGRLHLDALATMVSNHRLLYP